jgi:hypothetical protein
MIADTALELGAVVGGDWVRGRFSDPRRLELDEAVDNLTGLVDVLIQVARGARRTYMSRRFIGLCADLGPAPFAEGIGARREMWASLLRDHL